MSNQQAPAGMISVEEFGERKGINKEKVIKMIKDGFYVGRVVDEEWFIASSEISNSSSTSSVKSTGAYQSNYGVARKISKFLSFIGWLVFAIGVVFSLAGLASGAQSPYGGSVTLLALLPGIGISISGLFLVAAAQVTRATVDNADHTREILNIIREKV